MDPQQYPPPPPTGAPPGYGTPPQYGTPAQYGTPPPTPPPTAPASSGGGGTPPWLWFILGFLGMAVLALFAVLVFSGGDDDDTAGDETTTTAATAGEIFLEPADQLGPDPFVDQMTVNPAVTTTAPVVTQPPLSTSTTAPEGALVVSSLPGDAPGLYGGSGSNTVCDPAAQLAFLQQNPDLAAAWVAAQNADPTLRWGDDRTDLTVADLPAYFDELTPVALLYDTRVTNHGYRDGRPTPRQSVLQAGTWVLVDKWGVPRARCACGNPLTPPQPSPVPPTPVGPAWPGFDPTIVIVVDQSVTVINEITIINIDTGDTIIRPVGTIGDQDVPATPPTQPPATQPPATQPPATQPPATQPPLTIPDDVEVGTGDVQVTLIWNTDSDMDLHVVDPAGDEISFSAPSSPSGGQLDVDAIPAPGDTSAHVENIFWPSGGAPAGTYTAFVKHFSSQSGGPSSYTLEVRVGGSVVHTETGSLADGAESTPYTFTTN